MPRLRIELPDKFSFHTSISIRITDLNYGGHVGNDTILSLVHEARMQYLKSVGYTEMEFGGIGLIMSDAAIEFKQELFFGDVVKIAIASGSFSKVAFDLFYKLEKEVDGRHIPVAIVKTGMVGYNYRDKKVAAIPEEAKRKLSG